MILQLSLCLDQLMIRMINSNTSYQRIHFLLNHKLLFLVESLSGFHADHRQEKCDCNCRRPLFGQIMVRNRFQFSLAISHVF